MRDYLQSRAPYAETGSILASGVGLALFVVLLTAPIFAQTTTDVLLQVNQTARINFALQVGSVTETVQVTAAPILLKTDRSDVGTVIDERSVVEMP